MKKENQECSPLESAEIKCEDSSEATKEIRKKYPHFSPGNYPNRQHRRKDAGINKRTLHQPNSIVKLLVFGKFKYKQYQQIVPMRDKKRRIIGYRKIIHTQAV